jgi:hypothetical protein
MAKVVLACDGPVYPGSRSQSVNVGDDLRMQLRANPLDVVRRRILADWLEDNYFPGDARQEREQADIIDKIYPLFKTSWKRAIGIVPQINEAIRLVDAAEIRVQSSKLSWRGMITIPMENYLLSDPKELAFTMSCRVAEIADMWLGQMIKELLNDIIKPCVIGIHHQQPVLTFEKGYPRVEIRKVEDAIYIRCQFNYLNVLKMGYPGVCTCWHPDRVELTPQFLNNFSLIICPISVVYQTDHAMYRNGWQGRARVIGTHHLEAS